MNGKPWEFNDNAIIQIIIDELSSIECLKTEPDFEHDKKVANLTQAQLMEYLWGVCDAHEPAFQFRNFRPQYYRWGCKECQKELKEFFKIK